MSITSTVVIRGSVPARRLQSSTAFPSLCCHPVTAPACSALSLLELAEFAKARNAVVFLSVGGQVGRSGQLQQFLTEEGISFTGPGALPCMTCADRVRLCDKCCACWLPMSAPGRGGLQLAAWMLGCSVDVSASSVSQGLECWNLRDGGPQAAAAAGGCDCLIVESRLLECTCLPLMQGMAFTEHHHLHCKV